MPFRNFLQKRSRGDFFCFKNIFFHYLKADGMALFSPVVENFKEGYVFFDFSFCMWLKNYIQCFTERYRKNNGWCAKSVACLRYLPPKHCHCNQKIALLRSYSITFLVSKIQLQLTYVLELLYFLQHFPAKHSVPLQPKKIQKKPSQKIRILIDILKKAFNPAYVELELVPFYFWGFKKNPLFKKT